MRWARKAPSPSDEGQAHRLAARMDIFFLHLFATVQKRLDEADRIASNGSTISMSAILADSIPIAGRKLPCFPSCQQLVSQASPRAPSRLWPTWTVTAQSMLNDGANHPKYGWKMENMCQTTNQLTIAAFFCPTRIDRKKNTPAIERVVSHPKNEIRL